MIGKLDAAQAAEAHLSPAHNAKRQLPEQQQTEPQRQTPAKQPRVTRSNSSRNGRPDSTGQRRRSAGDAASATMLPEGTVECDAQSCVCLCTDSTRAAEAIKRGAEVAGFSTESATVAALATGHGVAVCLVLQGLVQAALARHQGALCR